MLYPDKALSAAVSEAFEKACKDFTARVAGLAFRRTKRMLWTRRHARMVEFIAFHRSGSSYGAPINAEVDIEINFGIRRLNDVSPVATLGGPRSDPGRIHAGRYHLRFNARSGSMYDRCQDDLHRFVTEHGEPWFRRLSADGRLDESRLSSLSPEERQFLQAACAREASADEIAASLKALGIKEK